MSAHAYICIPLWLPCEESTLSSYRSPLCLLLLLSEYWACLLQSLVLCGDKSTLCLPTAYESLPLLEFKPELWWQSDLRNLVSHILKCRHVENVRNDAKIPERKFSSSKRQRIAIFLSLPLHTLFLYISIAGYFFHKVESHVPNIMQTPCCLKSLWYHTNLLLYLTYSSLYYSSFCNSCLFSPMYSFLEGDNQYKL